MLQLEAQLADREVTIELTDEASEWLIQHGYDEQFQQHSVGLAVIALTIQAAIDEGLQEFDFLWGVEGYKALWSRDARMLRRVQLYPAGLGGRMHQHATEARRHVRALARRVIPRGDARVA